MCIFKWPTIFPSLLCDKQKSVIKPYRYAGDNYHSSSLLYCYIRTKSKWAVLRCDCNAHFPYKWIWISWKLGTFCQSCNVSVIKRDDSLCAVWEAFFVSWQFHLGSKRCGITTYKWWQNELINDGWSKATTHYWDIKLSLCQCSVVYMWKPERDVSLWMSKMMMWNSVMNHENWEQD